MRVVVTGSEGFVGQYICKKFLDEGHQVYGMDNHSKYGGSSRLHHTHQGNFEFIDLDLRDYNKTLDRFYSIEHWTKGNIDLLICCASDVGGIKRLSAYSPADILDNITLDNNTISAANRVRVKKIVYLSSSAIYEGLHKDTRITKSYEEWEDQFLFPHLLSPYSVYKWQTEKTLRDKRRNAIPTVIFRLFNAAGVGDNGAHPHVIADFVKRAKGGPEDPFDIMGDGKQTRNFIHGGDIASYIYKSIHLNNEVLNLGGQGNNISMGELAELIWKRVNPTKPFKINFLDGVKGDIQFSEPNLDKLHKELGPIPFPYKLSYIIDEAIQYYK